MPRKVRNQQLVHKQVRHALTSTMVLPDNGDHLGVVADREFHPIALRRIAEQTLDAQRKPLTVISVSHRRQRKFDGGRPRCAIEVSKYG